MHVKLFDIKVAKMFLNKDLIKIPAACGSLLKVAKMFLRHTPIFLKVLMTITIYKPKTNLITEL